MTVSGKRPAEDASTTRARLIEAGLDVFGEYGYTAASTRLLAERGGVNLAAIPYHFGGKEGLYQAVIDHIADRVGERLAPLLVAVEALLAESPPPRAQAAALLEQLLGALIDFVVGSPEAVRFSRIMLREQLYPSAAFATVFARVMQPLLGGVTGLLHAAGVAVPPTELQLRAFALLGQVLAFRFGRETVVRAAGLSGYSAEETALIREVVLSQTRAVLQGLVAAKEDAL